MENMTRNSEHQEIPEQRLWRAVIASTVQERVNGPLRKRREAEQYLLTDRLFLGRNRSYESSRAAEENSRGHAVGQAAASDGRRERVVTSLRHRSCLVAVLHIQR
jgi:hypothetical protein